MPSTIHLHRDLSRFAWLSIAAALATIGIKSAAYFLTNSVGLLSDALESGVNLVGALMQLMVLKIAAQPADHEHTFGHTKAEYFSSGAEGFLIFAASLSIMYAAIQRLLFPQPLEQVGIGLAVSVTASIINFVVAHILKENGKKYHSISLSAGGKHLMTDVWTSGGVVIAVGLVSITGWNWLDPLIAIAVALNILFTGYKIVLESIHGLMDRSISSQEQATLTGILDAHAESGIEYHEVRTRQAGAYAFITFHILVPGDWTVHHGHAFCDQIEQEIQAAIPNASVETHLESLDDPRSWM